MTNFICQRIKVGSQTLRWFNDLIWKLITTPMSSHTLTPNLMCPKDILTITIYHPSPCFQQKKEPFQLCNFPLKNTIQCFAQFNQWVSESSVIPKTNYRQKASFQGFRRKSCCHHEQGLLLKLWECEPVTGLVRSSHGFYSSYQQNHHLITFEFSFICLHLIEAGVVYTQ